MRKGKLLGLTKASFYIGDTIAKMFMHKDQVLNHFNKVFQGDEVGVLTTTVSSRTESLGHVVIDVEEFKTERTSNEGEEVSILMRPSIFKTRSF